MNSGTERNEPARRWRPAAAFYHPNGKGTGSAMKLELHPAHDQVDGCIMMHLANQSETGNRLGPTPTFPKFDWEGGIVVKLDFNDLCRILQVLRGECESVEEGRGLYHRTPKASTRICFRHLLEGLCGYSFEVYRTASADGRETRAHFILNPAEALGICEAIAGSMSVICFGVPTVFERKAPAEGVRDAAA